MQFKLPLDIVSTAVEKAKNHDVSYVRPSTLKALSCPYIQSVVLDEREVDWVMYWYEYEEEENE